MSRIRALLKSLQGNQQQATNSQVPGAPAPAPAPVVVPIHFAPQPAPAPAPVQQTPRIPFAFDKDQLQTFQQSVQQLNFAGGIPDDVITTAMSNPAAMRTLLNTIGQQAMASAVVMSAQHIGSQFGGHVSELVKAQVPGQMTQMSLDQALANNEVFSKSALLKNAAKTRASELAQEYPEASSQDILDVIVAEMRSEGIYPTTSKETNQQQQSADPTKASIDQLADLWGQAGAPNPAIDPSVPGSASAPAPAPVPQFQFQAIPPQ